jgi:hypothetical protein
MLHQTFFSCGRPTGPHTPAHARTYPPTHACARACRAKFISRHSESEATADNHLAIVSEAHNVFSGGKVGWNLHNISNRVPIPVHTLAVVARCWKRRPCLVPLDEHGSGWRLRGCKTRILGVDRKSSQLEGRPQTGVIPDVRSTSMPKVNEPVGHNCVDLVAA